MNTTTNETSAARDLSVLLVEDSALLVERLDEMLADIGGVRVVGAVDTEAAAVSAVNRSGCDVILLDLHLRQGTGFGVLRALAKCAQRPAVIVLTNYDLDEYRRVALSMGASYFLDKAQDMDRLSDMLGEIRSRPPWSGGQPVAF